MICVSLVFMLCSDLHLCSVILLGNRGWTVLSPRMVERIQGGNGKVMGKIACHGMGTWEMGARIRIFGRVFFSVLLGLLYLCT